MLLLLHRYLGIGLGVLMALWCLSGVVMIYVPFPMITESERLATLPPINWTRCCVLEGPGAPPESTPVQSFQLEMLGDVPVVRLVLADGTVRLTNPQDGRVLAGIERREAYAAAAQFGMSRNLSLRDARYELIDHDQWTVGGFRADRPLHWFAFEDTAGTEIYVSSRTGKVIQLTTRGQRFWSWLGAVPHWLYPSILRQHPQVWAQVVIWTSLLGTFLTVTGLYIGVSHLRRRRSDGAIASPYRGLMYWHHVPGLIFGAFALTWVVSGLLSMNPWGLMETQGFSEDRERLAGAPVTIADVARILEAVPRNEPAGVVSVRSAPFDGKLFAIGSAADATRARFGLDGAPAAFDDESIRRAVAHLTGPDQSTQWAVLTKEDAYHYSLGRSYAPLPAVRITAGAKSPTYYYLDAVSGELINKADAGGRAFRWWHSGLHRLDFAAPLRTDLARTLVMLPLLIGAAFVCVLGAYLGVRRLSR